MILAGAPLVATSCNQSSSSSSQVTVTVSSLEFTSTPQTSYRYGDSFVRPSVTANYSDGTSEDVTNSYKYSGFNSLKVGTQTITISFGGKTLTYKVTVVNEVNSITVSGQKTSFEVGDSFSLGGGKVYAVYDNGDKTKLTSSEYSVSGFDATSEGSGTITITYGEFTYSYSYTVSAASVYSVISLSFTDVQTEYEVGDEFVRPTATAEYNDGSTKDVSDYVEYSGFDSSSAGEITVTGTYSGVENSFNVTVSNKQSGGAGDVDPGDDTISGTFSIASDDGVWTQSGSVYTITGAGTYTLSGKLEDGQIVVNAPDLDLELVLNGVSIACSTDCPIYIVAASDVDISAKKNTTNYIYDKRASTVTDSSGDATGAAIYSEDGDIKLKGKGKLVCTSLNNNGIHGKDDVTIKNLTLAVRAVNHGIKGNDSVTFEENPTVDVICGNDGVKTSTTSFKNDGVTYKGTIYVYGGTIQINSYGDGLDAAYDVIIADSVDEDDTSITYSPTLDILTYKYSSFSSADFTDDAEASSAIVKATSATTVDSYKGIKGTHDINISGGTIYVKAYDDSVHGNKYSGSTTITYEDGTSAIGNVTITGGSLECYTNDDGVHADGTVAISGGLVNVTYSNEAVEGHIINISGGETYAVGSDDGVNATSTSSSSYDGQINVSGGYLDVTVPASGDVDGIDSNGTYTQTGGVVVTRGPASGGAWSLDTDSTVTVNGGSLIVVGGLEAASSSGGGGGWWLADVSRPGPGGGGQGGGGMGNATLTLGSNITSSTSSTGKAKGTFKVTIGGTVVCTYTNVYSYSGSVYIYSDLGSGSVTSA